MTTVLIVNLLFYLVILFCGHINFRGLFIAKVILADEEHWYDLTHCWGDKGVHTFSKGISPKVTVKERMEFEPIYFVDNHQHVNHYATGSSIARKHLILRKKKSKIS